MTQLITGIKLKTIQFYNNTNIILVATLILIKLSNIFQTFKKIFNQKLSIFNSENNNFFKKNLKFFFNTQISKTVLDFTSLSDYLFNENVWEIFYKDKIIFLSGLTIGKGTAGNIKRHNFSRGPVTHGSKHLRLQGSLGSGTTPGRTLPGKRMSGRLGCSIKNLKNRLLLINPKEGLILIKGSIPGKNNNLLLIK